MGETIALFYLYITWNVFIVISFSFEVKDILKESIDIDFNKSLADHESEGESNEHYLAGGPVSIDCLRCLCLERSNCQPIGCVLTGGTLGCGFFRFTNSFFKDCNIYDKDWRTCSNNLQCASKCVQNYMERNAKYFNCFQNCEGFTRELDGGPNGCNNPRTVAYWEKVQKVPGCKGVQ